MILEKIEVCAECLSPGIIYKDCICTYQRGYRTIELEFERCECCKQQGDSHANTEFNRKQLLSLNPIL